jgi:hypothetical protein
MYPSTKTITISLNSYIELALGSELKGCRTLPSYEDGLILQELVGKGLLFKVQFEEFDGTPMSLPKLWSYSEWSCSRTNYLRLKDRSEKERIARYILDANVKIVSYRLIKEYLFDEEKAKTTAYNLLSAKKFGNIRALGVTKLITKEEELS